MIVMALPSLVLTGLFYLVIDQSQPQYGQELNWASAKIFGCGLGIIFHASCWLTGAFTEDFRAVKNRVKEFFANIVVSVSLAFTCYWEDVKAFGVAFWIDFAVVALNIGIFLDAVKDFLALYIF